MIVIRRQKLGALAGLVAAVSLFAAPAAWGADENTPQLRKQGTATQLVVDGKPLLILGGTLPSAVTATREALQAAWPALAKMNVNTAIAPVAWSSIEPAEGRFDFSVVDGLIKSAHDAKMHLVIQWFGSWNRGTVANVPAWVKAAGARFPAQDETSGPPADAVVGAESKAFAALLKHIGQSDPAHTVVAAQVEDGIGGRRNCAAFVGKVSAAGKAEYPLPMFVDCAADPSLTDDAFEHLLQAWHTDAPAIDMLAPDIHAADFAAECKKFSAGGNPLFIADTDGGGTGAANMLYAVGKFNALGASVTAAPDAPDTATPTFYTTLAGMAPAILDNQGKGTLYAFMFGPGSPDEAAQQETAVTGPFTLTARASAPAGGVGAGRGGGGGFGRGGGGGAAAIPASTTLSGLVIAIKPNEFYVLHSGLNMTVAANDKSLGTLALGFQENGRFIDGKYVRYQRTNGDENDHDRRVDGAMNARWSNLHVAFYQRP